MELSTDWLEIQYLMAELDQLKDFYEELDTEAAWSLVSFQDGFYLLLADQYMGCYTYFL